MPTATINEVEFITAFTCPANTARSGSAMVMRSPMKKPTVKQTFDPCDLDSDDAAFGGFARRTPGQRYFTLPRPSGEVVSLYLPPRTALVLRRESREG